MDRLPQTAKILHRVFKKSQSGNRRARKIHFEENRRDVSRLVVQLNFAG